MRILAVVFAYNEGVKVRRTLERFPPDRTYDLAVMDDGSTDGSLDGVEQEFRCAIIRHETNQGAGAAVRTVLRYVRTHGYEIAVLVAGNDKDRPEEIPRLVEPIERGEADIVQGSRYLPGGTGGNMPLYRQLATRFVHPWLFSLVAWKRMTDTTNGFRAIRVSILDDERINLDQEWLSAYELEPYLLLTAIRLGYCVVEAPVTKVYPPRELGYTKMKPITGWWSILRPLVLMGLRIRR